MSEYLEDLNYYRRLPLVELQAAHGVNNRLYDRYPTAHNAQLLMASTEALWLRREEEQRAALDAMLPLFNFGGCF